MSNILRDINVSYISKVILILAIISFTTQAIYLDKTSLLGQTNDDSYISLRYAKNFAEGNGLVYNIGEYVEGYTNFLWTVLLAVAYKINIEPVLWAKMLGYATGVLIIIITYVISLKLLKDELLSGIVTLSIGLSGHMAYMSMWGLETTFFIAVYLSAFFLYMRKNYMLSSIFFALTTMTRPDGILFFFIIFCYSIYCIYKKEKSINDIFMITIPFVLIYGTYFLWRFSYYGFLLPNTFYAKVGFTIYQFIRGIKYLIGSLLTTGLFYFLVPTIILYPLSKRYKDKTISIFYYSLVIYFIFTIYVGGDHFKERFIVHVLPIIILVIAAFWMKVINHNVKKNKMMISIIFLMLLSISIFTNQPTFYGSINPWISMGKYINQISKSSDILATDAAGAIPYYSNLTTIDILGLADSHIAHKEIKTMGLGAPGHEKLDNVYVLDRRPRFITTWLDPDGGAGRGFKQLFEFRRNYYLHSLLETSIGNANMSRIKKIDNIPREQIIKLASRDKQTGVYDWGLFERYSYPLNYVNLSCYDLSKETGIFIYEGDNCYAVANKNIDKQGFLIYGPYMKFSPGNYNITYILKIQNVSKNPIVKLDIYGNDSTKWEKDLLTNDFNKTLYTESTSFQINPGDTDTSFEFRVWYYGNADVTLLSISLQKIDKW